MAKCEYFFHFFSPKVACDAVVCAGGLNTSPLKTTAWEATLKEARDGFHCSSVCEMIKGYKNLYLII